jgi:glucose-6-phosphate 1-epimerase
MSAMKDEAYKEFVCIESANAFEDFIVLTPEETHTLKATIY